MPVLGMPRQRRPSTVGAPNSSAPQNYPSGTADATATRLAALEAFMGAQPNENPCGEQYGPQINRLLTKVYNAHLNGIDFNSIMRVLYQTGLWEMPQSQLSGTRWDGGRMKSQTRGKWGVRGAELLPSTLWQVVGKNCNRIEQLNEYIDQITEGRFNVQTRVPLPNINQVLSGAQLDEINNAVAEFAASHPNCANPNLKEQVEEFMAIIDTYALNGEDLASDLRVLGLERIIPPFSRSNTRVNGMRLKQRTHGIKPSTYNNIKMSLTWKVLQEYCHDLETINNQLVDFATYKQQPIGSNAYVNAMTQKGQ